MENAFLDIKLTKRRSLNMIMKVFGTKNTIITIYENRKIYEIIGFRLKFAFSMQIHVEIRKYAYRNMNFIYL